MIITRLIDFPDVKTRAMVIRDENGDDNIYINSRLSAVAQMHGYIHELMHILRNDLDGIDADAIESEVHDACNQIALREMESESI